MAALRNPTAPQLVERLRGSGALAKIEAKYRVKLDPSRLLGCGKDACGWEHGDYAFKVTGNVADAQACLAILRLRRDGLHVEVKNHVARIFDVCDVGSGLWIVVSEILAPPTPEEAQALRAFSGSARELRFMRPDQVLVLLEEKTLLAAKKELPQLPPETVERAWRAWRALAILLRDHGVKLYEDALPHNFGRDEAGHLKLFDFGDSSFPGGLEWPAKCEWSCPAVAQNPRAKKYGLTTKVIMPRYKHLASEIRRAYEPGFGNHPAVTIGYLDSFVKTLAEPDIYNVSRSTREALNYDAVNILSSFQGPGRERIRVQLANLAHLAVDNGFLSDVPDALIPSYERVGEKERKAAVEARAAEAAAFQKTEAKRLAAEKKAAYLPPQKVHATDKAQARARARLLEVDSRSLVPIEKSLPVPREVDLGPSLEEPGAWDRMAPRVKVANDARYVEVGEGNVAARRAELIRKAKVHLEAIHPFENSKVKDGPTAEQRIRLAANVVELDHPGEARFLRGVADDLAVLDYDLKRDEAYEIKQRAGQIELNPTIYETTGGRRRMRFDALDEALDRAAAEGPTESSLMRIEKARVDTELAALDLGNQRPRAWPAGKNRPVPGDYLWFHQVGGPTVSVVVKELTNDGRYVVRRIGRAGETTAATIVRLDQLSRPTPSEIRIIDAERVSHAKKRLGPGRAAQLERLRVARAGTAFTRKPRSWSPSPRKVEWFDAAMEDGHEWVEAVAREGWVEKIEAATGLKLGEILGCGAFGCAFSVVSPKKDAGKLVVKITSDQSEGPSQAYIRRGQERGDSWSEYVPGQRKGEKVRVPVGLWFQQGYTRVREVLQLAKKYEIDLGPIRRGRKYPGSGPFVKQQRTIYAIVREDVDPDWKKSLPTIKERLVISLSKYRAFAQQYNQMLEEKYPKSLSDRTLREAEKWALNVESVAPSVARGLAAWFAATKRLQQDVHAGNVGLRVRAEFGRVGDLVIFDPGMSASKKADAAMRDIRLVANNPCPGVML